MNHPNFFNPAYPPAPAWERLLRHRVMEGGCWIWTGTTRARASDGRGKPYGGIDLEGRTWLVHRLAYTLANGPIQAGLQVDHMCQRTLCFNPEHLRLLTPKEHAATRDPEQARRSMAAAIAASVAARAGRRAS